MTVDVNEFFAVEVRPPKKRGPRDWVTTANIIRRDTHTSIKTVSGRGGAQTTALKDALENGKREAYGTPIPKDWSGPIPQL